jgi:hypothetical protein
MATKGKLEKLLIQGFKDPNYKSSPVGTFKAYLNPNEITLSYEVEYDNAQGAGTTNSRMNFNKIKPGTLSLTFFLDGTGAYEKPGDQPIDVQQQVKQFQKTTVDYNGDIHRPNYLIVAWGTLPARYCVLKSANIVYKLFRPNGVPLRAVITATFTDNSDDQTMVAINQPQSADLTHVRQVKEGDNLPALCYDIYEDPGYYLEVARANRLNNFRTLTPGMKIFFPPLEK